MVVTAFHCGHVSWCRGHMPVVMVTGHIPETGQRSATYVPCSFYGTGSASYLPCHVMHVMSCYKVGVMCYSVMVMSWLPQVMSHHTMSYAPCSIGHVFTRVHRLLL
jgi:hypothetical protein